MSLPTLGPGFGRSSNGWYGMMLCRVGLTIE